MDIAEFDIGKTLRKRLDEILAKKNLIGTSIETKKVQLKNLFSSHKPIRTTIEQLDSKINDLERRRTQTSLSLSEEKGILRQMDQIKKSKIDLAARKVQEQTIQEKKSEVESLRDEMRTVTAQIAELEAAIAKIDLAKRLGCATQDLRTHVVDCPLEKLGEVIGKGGLKIKKLEEETGCIINVDKVKGQVHLRGNAEVIQNAIAAVENITHSVTEIISLTPEMHSFLFGNGMDPMKKLRKNHDKVNMDLSRDTKILKIRGKVDALELVKADLGNLKICRETINLGGHEAGLIIGKKGANIKSMSEKFSVAIDVNDVSDDAASVAIVGASADVDGAVEAINHMIFENKDIISNVVVSNVVRNDLLQDAGKKVKETQKKANELISSNTVRLMFEKQGDNSSSVSLLEVKCPRLHHTEVLEFVRKRVADYESNALTIKIEPYMVPKFVGKGGKHINELKKLGGKGVVIELDRVLGEVSVMTKDEATKEIIKTAIQKFIADNQILKVPVDNSIMSIIFGSKGKDLRSTMDKNDVNMQQLGLDAVTLKGSIEHITEAAATLRDFIASNYVEKVEFEPSDSNQLQRKGSILSTIEKEDNVKAHILRSRGIVEISGLQKNVETAVAKLRMFLFGGDQFSVFKLSIPGCIIGGMIGKGGSNLSKVEKDFDGVRVGMNNVINVMTIRGEDDAALACRKAVVNAMAKLPAIETISIDAEVHESLSQKSILRKVTDGLQVTVTLTNAHVKLRGSHLDVPAVKASIVELDSGLYEGFIPFSPTNFKKVVSTLEKSPDLEEIQSETNVDVQIDHTNLHLKVTGKRSGVKKAKLLLLQNLKKILPRCFSEVKVPRYYVKSARDTRSIMHMSAESQCDIYFDHDLQTFILQAESSECLPKGIDLIAKRLKECDARMFLVDIKEADSWVLQTLLKSYRHEIYAIENTCECKIDVFKSESKISIIEKVDSAKDALEALIDRIKEENVFMDLPESSMPHFVGQSMKHISKFAKSHHVEINRVKKKMSRICIHGEGAAVSKAANAVREWIEIWEGKNPGTNVLVNDTTLQVLLDLKPSSEKNRISSDCGVKLDVYCLTSSVMIRGGNDDSHAKALMLIEALGNDETEKKDKEVQEMITIGGEESEESKEIVPDTVQDLPAVQDSKQDSQDTTAESVINSFEDNAVQVVVVENKSQVQHSSKSNNTQTISKMFNFLVSDAHQSFPNENAPQDPWDASTISGSVDNVGEGYFRSTSGLIVRL